MKLFDKILLGLLSIAAVLAGIILALIALGWGIHTDLGSSAALFSASWLWFLWVFPSGCFCCVS